MVVEGQRMGSMIERALAPWAQRVRERANLPAEFVDVAMPGGRIAPNLVKRGIKGRRVLVCGGGKP